MGLHGSSDAEARIEDVAEGVAEHIERIDGEGERGAWGEDHPGGVAQVEGAGRGVVEPRRRLALNLLRRERNNHDDRCLPSSFPYPSQAGKDWGES